MRIKGMQQEETKAVKDDQNVSVAAYNGKQSPTHQEMKKDSPPPPSKRENSNGESSLGHVMNGNGPAVENSDSSSPTGPHGKILPVNEPVDSQISSTPISQSFELGPDVSNSYAINSYWGKTPAAEESNVLPPYQAFNSSMMPSYSMNNNNSFPQPLAFGSIGQPSYMPVNNQFSSPPGMPSLSMMSGMAPMSGPATSFNHQSTHSQNQRRAITAQHNYASMNNKPLNPRFPWNSHQGSWPGNNQQPNVSPWTMALQQQKAMSRGGMPHSTNGPTPNKSSNHSSQTAINTLVAQQKLKRSGSPNQMTGSGDSMKMDSLQAQLMDIMRHSSNQFDPDQQKGFGDGIESQFSGGGGTGDDGLDHAGLAMNGCGGYPGPMSSLSSSYRSDRPERFSRKVFVGGLPPDIDEEEITASFNRFGPVVVDWPHKAESKSYFPPKGYCFLLFQEEISVQDLIDACLQDDNKLYWCVTSPTMKDKPVQIRPWSLNDSDFVMDGSQTLDPRKTIFVGGVPRPLRAIELASIIERLYGGVCYAGIDTDPELKYPKGAGRVAFSNQQSYIAAISARFVQLQHGDIDKRVEVKPYVLDDQYCDECHGARCNQKFAPFFCANITCLQYYCEQCWATIHSRPGREFHKPLVKEGADRPRAVPFRWC